jgi:phospholipase/carboxylesterase
MALDIGPQLPLAGQIILSGYLHSEALAPSQPSSAIMVVHGSFDPVVPVAKALPGEGMP